MSTKMNTTAPATATKSSAVMSEADMIKAAWDFDASLDIYFYIVLGVAYAATLLPSFVGSAVISPTRAVMWGYLVYDCIVRFLDLDKKPKSEAKIWNITNWALYSLRRACLEYFIVMIHGYTQAIPFANWVLNLIPIALTYVNIFVL